MSHRIIDLPAAAAHRQKPRLADETVERRQRRQSNMDLLRARALQFVRVGKIPFSLVNLDFWSEGSNTCPQSEISPILHGLHLPLAVA